MKTWNAFRYAVAWCLVLLIAMPPPILAQETSAKPDARASGKVFSQADLEQLTKTLALSSKLSDN